MSKKLFVVTNRKLVKNRTLEGVVDGAVNGGADAIILREKDMSSDELFKLAISIKKVIRQKIPLIINGNFETAKKAAVSGIQLSYDKFIKFNYTYDGLKGCSVHSLEEAVNAEKSGADYVIGGHIFKTACKQGLEPRGTDFLKNLCDNLHIPVIAIGGIEISNIKSVIDAGATGIAVMSSVMEAGNPQKVVYELKQKLI